jgi:DNA polymerase-3 subunit gamma/tau
MGHEALARKWRPRSFDEIVGQGHVTRALANAISSGKIHHAYLFAGTRGVGKTTFARILARALNCESGPTTSPCLSCPACREILAGTSIDVQEIDGASNTGIDDVRRLRENAAYTPSRLRYKVYIIDEVHMLSRQAFNGLLKILEEPPPHVVFVFATTEPNRIPDTILSRVQRYDFRMLTEEEIHAHLKNIARAEEIRFEEDALRLVARYAFGSMRDGQSIVEQAAVSGSGAVTANLVEELLGLVGTESAIDLLSSVVAGGAGEAIRKFSSLLSRGADLKFLYLAIVDLLRDVTVLKFTGNEQLLHRHSPSSLERVKEMCGRRSQEEWMFLLDIAFRSEKDVLATEFPRLGFELLLLRLVNAPNLLAVEGIGAGPSEEGVSPRDPAGLAGPAPDAARSPAPRPIVTTEERKGDPAPAPSPIGRRGREETWEGLLKILSAKRKTVLLSLLSQMKGHREGEALVITCQHQFVLDRLREEDKWPVLVQAASEAAGRKLEVRLSVSDEKKSPESDGALREEAHRERRALSDPLLVEVLREFDGATLLEVRPSPAGAPGTPGGSPERPSGELEDPEVAVEETAAEDEG